MRIKTLSLAEVPQTATIEIRLPPEEGSDELRLAVSLADQFSFILKDMGYTPVEVDGELLFRFAIEEPTYARKVPGRRDFGRAREAAGRPLGRLAIHVAAGGAAELSAAERETYRLRVSVARRQGPPLWTGYIERSVKGVERQAAYLEMAEILMELWGQTHFEPD